MYYVLMQICWSNAAAAAAAIVRSLPVVNLELANRYFYWFRCSDQRSACSVNFVGVSKSHPTAAVTLRLSRKQKKRNNRRLALDSTSRHNVNAGYGTIAVLTYKMVRYYIYMLCNYCCIYKYNNYCRPPSTNALKLTTVTNISRREFLRSYVQLCYDISTQLAATRDVIFATGERRAAATTKRLLVRAPRLHLQLSTRLNYCCCCCQT